MTQIFHRSFFYLPLSKEIIEADVTTGKKNKESKKQNKRISEGGGKKLEKDLQEGEATVSHNIRNTT
jgi:hypothetical protein